MSIADKILALQTDSAAIASAIAAKGVTVPTGSGYDDYATLIGQISGGGSGGGAHTLPSGYTRLEYIENPLGNTAYINTGLISNRQIGFEIDYMSYDDNNSTSYGCIIGARYSSNNADVQLTTWTGSSGTGTLRLGTSQYNYDAHLPSKNTRFQAKLISTTYTINSTTLTVGRPSINGYQLCVFALNQNGTISQNGHGKIYSLKFYSYDMLVRDYVPCKNTSNVVGLYDLISEVFYSSPNSSTFTAGPAA